MRGVYHNRLARMTHKLDFIEAALAHRQSMQQRRQLKVVDPQSDGWVTVDGRAMLDFCSNDYLGLSRHPLLIARSQEYLLRFGSGATASRLICGNRSFFGPVEERLASLKGSEAALIFNSGFQANVSILPVLADRSSLILSDQLNHNSLIQGARLARCRIEVFRHNDLEHLRLLLSQSRHHNYSRKIIVTESIFSMDGDLCPLDELVAIADAFDAILVVDEAHATGVAGPKGMGLTCGKGVDVSVGTFSKACGAFGAYVACSRTMREYLINCSPGLIYSTALPPAVLGAVDAALEVIPGMASERRRLHQHAAELRRALQDLGWDCGKAAAQIVPITVGPEAVALELSQWLARHDIFATAIRPPTVERDRSRIRLAVSAVHQKEDITRVIDVFSRWSRTVHPAPLNQQTKSSI